MLISYSHRFLFIHVGKTGGMSVRAVLEPVSGEPEKFIMRRPAKMIGGRPNPLYRVWETLLLHAKARDAQKEFPADLFNSLFKFAFVRNPWDLQVSMYHFILREPEAAKHDEVKALGTFDAFVDWVIANPDPYPRGITKLQKDMITDAAGKPLLDFIGTWENLAQDFAYVAGKVGINAALPHVNRSCHRDYRTYYNDRTRALIAEHFRPDIELFGYTFNGYAGGSLKEMYR
jgi:hypothetical protein